MPHIHQTVIFKIITYFIRSTAFLISILKHMKKYKNRSMNGLLQRMNIFFIAEFTYCQKSEKKL